MKSGNGDLAIRQSQWKYIPNLSLANGWESHKSKTDGKLKGPGLYILAHYPGETENLVNTRRDVATRLAGLLKKEMNPDSEVRQRF